MSFRPIYEGWDIPSRLSRKVRSRFAGIGLNRDLVAAEKLADDIGRKLEASELASAEGQHAFAKAIALDVMEELVKFTWLVRGRADYLVDRYSERVESAEELSKRVNQRSL